MLSLHGVKVKYNLSRSICGGKKSGFETDATIVPVFGNSAGMCCGPVRL
jgi:hypothetical protein